MKMLRFGPLLAALAASAAAQHPAALPSRAALGEAAACVLAADRRAGGRLARAVPGSADEAAAWAALARPLARCTAAAGFADSTDARPLLAGRIAETLYWASTGAFESRPASRPAPPGPVTLAQAIAIRTIGWPAEAALAECVTAIAPNDVDRLVRAAPGSSGETAATAGIRAALPACLAQGQSLTMARARLRAELARAIYRFVAVIAGPLVPGGAR
jgi:hypothetical protein